MSEVHLSVADAYDRWAEGYDAYDNNMVRMAARAVEELAPEVRGKAVLEFGCGTGRNLEVLKAAGAARLAGLDLSSGMLEQAAARDGAFELHRQDMAAPAPFADGSFDLVLFCLTLEHVRDLVTPLKEARRLLRAEGQVVVIEIHPFLSLGGLGAHFSDGGQVVRMPTVPHGFADHLNAFAAAGLTVRACREWRPRDYGDPIPARLLKRGPDTPYVVEFRLAAA